MRTGDHSNRSQSENPDSQTRRRLFPKLRRRAGLLKRDILAMALVAQDPRLGRLPKILAFLTLAYAFSPIDLIPDFIPVLGLLDDLIILPLLIALTLKSIPPTLMEEARIAVGTKTSPPRRRIWFFVPFILTFWGLLIFAGLRWILQKTL